MKPSKNDQGDWTETNAILADEETMAAIAEGLAELDEQVQEGQG